jgi:hypothetical protein
LAINGEIGFYSTTMLSAMIPEGVKTAENDSAVTEK